ncbi:hypothetical protein PENSPDRAFT_693888 [Peniophora sp. CONT]|nr:hypothetical protein PENSPDRAFT_693888 [Peniophora sp. CONT]
MTEGLPLSYPPTATAIPHIMQTQSRRVESELEVRLAGLDLRSLIMDQYLQDESQDSGYTANPESLTRDAELVFDVTLGLGLMSGFGRSAPSSRPDSDEEEGEVVDSVLSASTSHVGTRLDSAPSRAHASELLSHPDSDDEEGEIAEDDLYLPSPSHLRVSPSPSSEAPPISRSPSTDPPPSTAQIDGNELLEGLSYGDIPKKSLRIVNGTPAPRQEKASKFSLRGFRWYNSDGSLRVVIPTHLSVIKTKPAAQTAANPRSEAEIPDGGPLEIPGSRKRRRRQGVEAGKRRKIDRNQKRKPSAIGEEAASASRRARLVRRNMSNSEGHVLTGMSLIEDGNIAKSGFWMGGNPPELTRIEIQDLWETGQINEHLRYFLPIPYRHPATLVLADRQLRIFLYRGFQAQWLVESGPEISDAIYTLMGDDLRSPSVQAAKAKGPRGNHLPVILGYMRDRGMQGPSRTAWHNSHMSLVEKFKSTKVIRDLTRFVSAAVAMTFPGVEARFKECAEWHRQHNHIEPEFGLFYNFCINGFFLGSKGSLRVHCKPHADAKNPISVCVLMAWLQRGANYDTRTKSWLVIWEAGVVIELPFWTLLIYPSSLFYHFNVDIEDIKFVLTTDGMPPSKEAGNYEDTDLPSDAGRGSFVWFNMASMFQSSESGFQSLKAAKDAGFKHKTVSDYKQAMQQAFNNNASYFEVPRSK